ncbi:NFX1-type zinc finger-containing protein 1, partial [Pseudolycoriella hygida]
VEEAAEVLEAHIVTALCERTDHLILIGDHLQLRPNPAVYELATRFNLQISLFERLIKNQMEYYQLKQQHRMRPCISSLLVPHIYKQLLDHPSVEEYEDVKGISKNMFFLNHCENEASVQDTKSHLNQFEAEFIVELCRYIVLQGYETSQVTILTTYSGQLYQIRKLMRTKQILNGVRATVVDNYQGEECDIILLSFVRSNEEGNIGFLKDSHRVNVALSRARKGLYCIGNFDCLSEKSTLWQNLFSDLKSQKAIGNALEIYCQNHTDYKSLVNSKDGFNVAPEGGCSRACGYRLPCGHACASVCHIIDVEHVDTYKTCHKTCDQIICEREHRCPKKCHLGEECGKCNKTVEKLRTECQHMVKVSCSGNPSEARCLNPCEKYRICGHKCKNICVVICEAAPCNEKVVVRSPCGHIVTVNCSDAKINSKLLDACTEPCGVELECGHLCKGSCGRCKLGRLHVSCNEKCTKTLVCGHPCTENCSIECPPCKKKCTNSCVHSACSFRCGDPCPPCMEKCTWCCEHLECSKLCCEPCDRISKNMFFLNHCENEASVQDTKSHLNQFEAEFIVELCRYIVLQGYETSQVTILTTYSGQLYQIRKLMRTKQILNGVRATVVDNYQGEECDIILLSFVRSNEEGNIGFLKDSHRVNVALSRARKGLYCIGNFDCLSEKSTLWQNLFSDLKSQKAIGNALEIYCQNHTDYKSLVNSKDGFNVAPEGGCSRACGYRLPCGHACASVCHIIDVEHVDTYKTCHKTCDQIICEREHRCPKKCHLGEECGKCNKTVEKLRTECQHMVKVSCSGNPSEARCLNPCEKYRICGHKCKNICVVICEAAPCNEKVVVRSPCGHIVTVNCSDAKINSKLLDACTEPCGVELECGHLCKGSCGRCKLGRLHVSCNEKCTKTLVCGHPCTENCSIECPPCKKKCTNSCVHSACSFRCGDPCPPCMEKCTWCCEHLECSKLCCEPCDRELCEHPNTNLIKKCGHPSIGVCGEEMPRLCRICNKDDVQDIFFGEEDEEDARFIELKDCKHIIEVGGLIHWLKSESESNETNSGGNSQNSIQFKKCPKCKTIIRHTKSLNTFIQESLRDIEKVKLITRGDPKENRKTQDKLFEKVDNILATESFISDMLHTRSIYKDILFKIKLKKAELPKPKQILNQLSNKFELVEKLRKIWTSFQERQMTQHTISIEVLDQFDRRLRMAASFIRDFKNSDQQRKDITDEVTILELMCDVVVKASRQPSNDTGKKLLNEAFVLANNYGGATETVRNAFKAKVNEASRHSSGLGISMEEKRMVLQAMGLSSGHWYKCPNGHVYAIGDCGGAMQTSTCPECKATIGGQSHRLRSDNAVATEMDGATRPAWPQ